MVSRDLKAGCSWLRERGCNGQPVQSNGSSSKGYRQRETAWLKQYPQFCKTQVSLEPPPCDELTTSDPLRSATRVRPPGTIVTDSPKSTYGLKSTCRGPICPFSVKHGAVESESVGCAM